MSPRIKVAQVAQTFTFENADHVLEVIKIFLRNALDCNVELISFPKLFLRSQKSPIFDAIFAAIGNIAKKYKVNCVFGYSEQENGGDTFSCQCIISAHGEKFLRRRKLCNRQDLAEFRSTSITAEDIENMAVKLPFSVGIVEVGCLLGYEFLNPLLVHCIAAKNVKIVLSSFDDGTKTPVINDIMAGTSQQIGSYVFTSTSKEDHLKAWSPHGTPLFAESTTNYLSIYNIDFEAIAFQKNLIDIVGRDSRPSLLSVKLDY